jgi:hypothetical protein
MSFSLSALQDIHVRAMKKTGTFDRAGLIRQDR